MMFIMFAMFLLDRLTIFFNGDEILSSIVISKEVIFLVLFVSLLL